ncbi:hypothetical protein BDV29DRAFT_151897 [Aspergillus leporis]|uniref:Protein kinase domain-containing protein n=1 Tax=Aspergillus leporis TaxID=41062 RepID=A0A5N5XI98_9EURO|nr:hypothetical protein BDV29DRAFT_151897 [Aspergillus leporis]
MSDQIRGSSAPARRNTVLPTELGNTYSKSLLPKFLFEKEPPKVDVPGAFRNQRFPPPDDKIFLPIIAAAGWMSCLGRANTRESPVSYFKTCPLDAFLEKTRLIFTYDSWGISLQEILRVHNVFAFDKSAVAIICKEILNGLKYLHDKIGVVHGSLSCRTVVLTDEGQVKIANIGESMARGRKMGDIRLDVEGILQIAEALLQVKPSNGSEKVISAEAESFVRTSTNATVDELLSHRFLEEDGDQWYLQPHQSITHIAKDQNSTNSSNSQELGKYFPIFPQSFTFSQGISETTTLHLHPLSLIDPVVVTFLSPLDDKCKAVASKIEELWVEFTSVKFYRVDVRKDGMLSRALSNTEMPIVVFAKNGRDILTLDSDVSLPSIWEGLQALQMASR